MTDRPTTRPVLGGDPLAPDTIAADPTLRELAGLLAYLDLHLGRFHWTVLTTRQKELLADLIDADGTITTHEDPNAYPDGDNPRTVERWWRDDYTPPAD